MNNLTQRYEIRSNEEIYNAFGEPNIIVGVIKTKSWLGLTWSQKKSWIGNPEERSL